MKILSIQVGKPKTVEYNGKSVTTGIFKEPVPGPILLKTLNLEGDGQADLRVHGGPDKALYAYAFDAYPLWKQLRPQDSFPFGAFGENLSMDTLPEDSIYVGDTYELGEAVVQVAQPRFPCYKLAVKFEDPQILKQFMSVGRSGVYFRILKEGLVDVGDELKLVDREETLFPISEFFSYIQQDAPVASRIREILNVQGLPAQWKAEFESWL